MKTKLLTLTLALSSFLIYAQTTYVPDDNFEAYLEANGMGDGIANNDYVTTANISNVTSLDVNGQSIYDLTGIEDFTALQTFDCHLNPISTMKLPSGNNLLELYCYNLDLTSLDVSSHTALTVLNCRFNDISTLNLSANNNLTYLDCWGNPLGALTVSNLGSLTFLNCRDTMLNTLDVSMNTNLEVLDCTFNNLTTLNLTTNTSLTNIYCSSNNISTLMLPNTNTLEILQCFYNSLSGSSLDVSNNPNLLELWTEYNQLSSLDLSANTALTYLDCKYNSLTSLTLPSPSSPDLATIICDHNMLPSLNLTGCSGLTGLYANSNDLTNLDVTDSPDLLRLWCHYNDLLTYINFDNPVLWELRIQNNTSLTNLNNTLSLTGLVDLWGWNCNLTTLDLTNSMVLEYAEPGDNPNLTNLTLPDTTTLTQLWAYGCNLSTLDYTNNTGLQYLDIGINNFTSADVSMLPNLLEFYCNQNQLTSLNLKNGHNNILDWMWADDNTSLSCIQVDDKADADSRDSVDHWRKDNTATYEEDCALSTQEFDLSSISVYPNPAKNKVYIELQSQAKYTLTNIFGQQIRKGAFVSGKNSLDLQSLSNGLYFLDIETPDGKATKKLIKE